MYHIDNIRYIDTDTNIIGVISSDISNSEDIPIHINIGFY